MDQLSDSRHDGAHFDLTLSMVEAGSRYLFEVLGPHDDVDYRDVVAGVIRASLAHARIGQGWPGLGWPKK